MRCGGQTHKSLAQLPKSVDTTTFRVVVPVIVVALTLFLGTFCLTYTQLERAHLEELDAHTLSITHQTADTLSARLDHSDEVIDRLETLVENDVDAVYAIVTDLQGNVLQGVHTNSLLTDAIPRHFVPPGSTSHLTRFTIGARPIHEAAVLIPGESRLLRVGTGEDRIQAALQSELISGLSRLLLLLLLGLGLAMLAARRLVAPLRELVAAASELAAGAWDRRVVVGGSREVAHLGKVFNQMSAQLQQTVGKMQAAQEELRRSNERLQQQGEESRTLHAIANLSARRLPLEELLPLAARRFAEAPGANCVALWVTTPRNRQEVTCTGCPADPGGDARCGLPTFARLAGHFQDSVFLQGEQYLCCPDGGNQRLDVLALPLRSPYVFQGGLAIGVDRPTLKQQRFFRYLASELESVLENALLWEELTRQERVQDRLLKSLMAAQEEERQRVARELHDESSQYLASLMFAIDRLGRAESVDTVRESLPHCRELVHAALDHIHQVVLDLRPAALDDLGLIPALERLCTQFEERTDIQVHLAPPTLAVPDPPQLEPVTETVVYRIIQEALNNVAHHSGASHVWVEVDKTDDLFAVSVTDNGCGFNQRALEEAPMADRLGLCGMEERAALVQGLLEIRSQPGRGTSIRLELALAPGRMDAVTHCSSPLRPSNARPRGGWMQ